MRAKRPLKKGLEPPALMTELLQIRERDKNKRFLKLLFIISVFTHVHECGTNKQCVCVCVSEDNFWDVMTLDSGHQACMTKDFYLLSHLMVFLIA